MSKFSLRQQVFVKLIDKKGIITSISTTFAVNKGIRTVYKVAIPAPRWIVHSNGAMEVIGKGHDYITVDEGDLTRIEDSAAPTFRKECECGKEKHGFANHSGWCAMSKEERPKY